jgi:hypothetical protein
MKLLFAIYTLSFLFAAQQALAGAPMSSMNEHYDQEAKMCRQKPKPSDAALAQAAADPAAWILSLAPARKKEMLASCCTTSGKNTQANAE